MQYHQNGPTPDNQRHEVTHPERIAGTRPDNPTEFRDPLDKAHGLIHFDKRDPAERDVVRVLHHDAMQRLKKIEQHSNASMVVHEGAVSRFMHSRGTAFVMKQILESVVENSYRSEDGEHVRENFVEKWRHALLVGAAVHDIGHIAGSHKFWGAVFPELGDLHEEITLRFILEEPGLVEDGQSFLRAQLAHLLSEPPTSLEGSLELAAYQILHGKAVNADRLEWGTRDQFHFEASANGFSKAGAFVKGFGSFRLDEFISKLHVLPLEENRNDFEMLVHDSAATQLLDFCLCIDSAYRERYQSKEGLALDTNFAAIFQCAKHIHTHHDSQDIPMFEAMDRLLTADHPSEIPLKFIKKIVDHYVETHFAEWREDCASETSDHSPFGQLHNLVTSFDEGIGFHGVTVPLSQFNRAREEAIENLKAKGIKDSEYLVQQAICKGSLAKDINGAPRILCKDSERVTFREYLDRNGYEDIGRKQDPICYLFAPEQHKDIFDSEFITGA